MGQVRKTFTKITSFLLSRNHLPPILLSLFFFLASVTLFNSTVMASDPTFSFYPDGGVIMDMEDGFVVDVLIDTAGQEILSAKFTVTFDPEVLQVRQAERNNTLFAQFPQDESTIDNSGGVVMLSGFSQSGTGGLYVTEDSPDVFARLTFDVLQEVETVLDWQYSGDDGIFDSAMYKDGSPPQNILLTKPRAATFTVGDAVGDDPIIYDETPDTGLALDEYILVTGLVLVLFGAFMVFTRPGNVRKKTGIVVLHDE